VKFRTIIVVSLLQKCDKKRFNEELKASNKNCKVNGSVFFVLSVFFTTFSFCVIFIIEVYTVLIYCFLMEKVGGSEKSRLLGGSEKNRLLNGVVNGPADNVTCAVRNGHCLPEHKFRVLFATGQWSTTLCWNSRNVSTSRCRNSSFFAFH